MQKELMDINLFFLNQVNTNFQKIITCNYKILMKVKNIKLSQGNILFIHNVIGLFQGIKKQLLAFMVKQK